jgi:hypothetical protein
MRSNSPLTLAFGFVLAAAVGFGCGSKNKDEDTTLSNKGGDRDITAVPKVDATLCETKGKKIDTFDLNRDDRPDVWKLSMKIEEGEVTRSIATCKQVDLNFDGKKDYVVGYNRKGAREFEKFDYDFDGAFDAYSIYDPKTGAVVGTSHDGNADGIYEIEELYDAKGNVKSILRDVNADGKEDVWEQYVDGRLVAVLHDDDFDGKVDRREEVQSEIDRRKKSAAGDLAAEEADNQKASDDEDKRLDEEDRKEGLK